MLSAIFEVASAKSDRRNEQEPEKVEERRDNLREFVDSRHPGDTHACWVRVRPAVAATGMPGMPGAPGAPG